jgi:hypothetical protein
MVTVAFMSALLILMVAGTLFVNFGVANPNPFLEESWMDPPVILIHSPTNKAYESMVLLNFTVARPESWLSTPVSFGYEQGSGLAQEMQSIICYLDNQFYMQIMFLSEMEENEDLASPVNHFEYLTNLTNGVHTLTIRASATGVVRKWVPSSVYSVPISSSAEVKFTFKDVTSPIISVFSPQDKAYDTPDVPLNFTVNEPVSQIAYSLDGQENVTIHGNTTLTNLPYGKHNVTIYAIDEAGNVGTSETINFTISAPEQPEPEAFPSELVATASGASITIVGVGLLVYFKKRKR